MLTVWQEMRVAAIFLTFCLAVFLALPEILCAPTDTCSDTKNNDDILYHKRTEEESKSSEVQAKTTEKKQEEFNRSKDNMFSGSYSTVVENDLLRKEEEKQQMAEEKKTARESSSINKSARKKKLVSLKEKKTVLVYYMVSYKRLPAKKECESKVEYYRRIFPKEKDKRVFYRKIFKVYDQEEPKAYLERVEFIWDNVYPEEDPRLDLDWLEQFDHYYTLKYCRKVDETDDHYFPRVLKKFVNETSEHYKKRMQCLVEALDEEDFSHITFDDSEEGFKIGKRKTPARSRSSPESAASDTGLISKSTRKTKAEQEAMQSAEKSTEEISNKGSSSTKEKDLKKSKSVVETEESTTAYAFRVAYTKLPVKPPGQSDKEYYENFFGKYNPKMNGEERGQLLLKICVNYKGENVTNYVKRLDYMFDNVYPPEFDIRTKKFYLGLLSHYYRQKYSQCDKETLEQWFARVLTKLKCESPSRYEERVECLKSVFSNADWSKVTIEPNTPKGFRFNCGSGNSQQPTDQGSCSAEEGVQKTNAKKSDDARC